MLNSTRAVLNKAMCLLKNRCNKVKNVQRSAQNNGRHNSIAVESTLYSPKLQFFIKMALCSVYYVCYAVFCSPLARNSNFTSPKH